MDPFVEIPIAKWPELKQKLRSEWPLNVAGYYALDLIINYPKVRDAFQFKVYCPNGDINYGFISTNVKETMDVIIFPNNRYLDKMEEALKKTALLNWKENIYCIDLVTSTTLNYLQRILPILGLKQFDIHLVKTQFLDKNTKPFENLRCPQDTYLAAVKKDWIQLVDSTWPYKYSGSYFYFSTLADNDLSFALYNKSDDTLLAWIFLNEYNFLCHLYCEKDFRKRGYAEYIMKYVINEQLAKGNDVYTFVEIGNDKSAALFRKLGFAVVDQGGYVYVR